MVKLIIPCDNIDIRRDTFSNDVTLHDVSETDLATNIPIEAYGEVLDEIGEDYVRKHFNIPDE